MLPLASKSENFQSVSAASAPKVTRWHLQNCTERSDPNSIGRAIRICSSMVERIVLFRRVAFQESHRQAASRVEESGSKSLRGAEVESRLSHSAFLNRELEHRLRSCLTTRCQILNCYPASARLRLELVEIKTNAGIKFRYTLHLQGANHSRIISQLPLKGEHKCN